jgi:Pup amidohydrolase
MERLVEPAEFASVTPPPRIIGTECEYVLQGLRAENLLADGFISKLGLIACGEFYSNGSRMYDDQSLFEYATPESLGPLEATISDQSGIKVLAQIDGVSGLKHRGFFRQTGQFRNIRCTPPDGEEPNDDWYMKNTTRGYHENFLLPSYAVENKLFNETFPSFLASKLWDGQGTFVEGEYVLRQKIWSNGLLWNTSGGDLTAGQKPLYSLRCGVQTKEHDDDWIRLETRSSDACLSPAAKFVALGATSLVMRLYEHPEILKNIDLANNVSLVSPLDAAWAYARDLRMSSVARLQSGRDVSANNVQEVFLEACEALSERVTLPTDELIALKMWREIIDKQKRADLSRGEYAGLDKFSDNVALFAYLQKRFTVNAGDWQAQRVVQLWDRVSPEGGAMMWWSKFSFDLVPEEAVLERAMSAPKNTRAKTRADAIKNQELGDVAWDYVDSLGQGEQQLHSPYITY